MRQGSSSDITNSTLGLDNMSRSEPIGPVCLVIGYTVNLHPQPLTEPSLENFHLNSSPEYKVIFVNVNYKSHNFLF